MSDAPKTQDPSNNGGQSNGGQGNGNGTPPAGGGTTIPDNLPEELKGKSTVEIASMYQHLSKKLGEQSSEVNDARTKLEQVNYILEALEANPELYGKVKSHVQGYKRGGAPAADPNDPGAGQDGGTHGQPGKQGKVGDDVRAFNMNKVFDEFRTEFKIKDLPKEKREAIEKKVAVELLELLDPEGTKDLSTVMAEVRVDKLPAYLKKAWTLAHSAALLDNDQALLQDFASIGALSYTAGSNDSGDGLTEEQRKVAQRLGVKPEKYAEQLKSMKKKK